MSMRILQVNDYSMPAGGAECYVHRVKEALRERGHDVEVYGATRIEPWWSYVTRFWDPVIYVDMSRVIERFRPDVVHAHNVSRVVSPSVLAAAQRAGVPVVMTVHDFHLVCPKTWYVSSPDTMCTRIFGYDCVTRGCARSPYQLLKAAKVTLHRRLIGKHVDAFIAPCRLLADRLKEVFPDRCVTWLPNFVDVDAVEHSPPGDTGLVLFVGRLIREKGVDVLLYATPLILEGRRDARVVIVGTGPLGPELESLTDTLDVDGCVEFAGFVPDGTLHDLYERADVVVLPSRWAENSPFVLFEALGHGRPVVASDMGGLPEVVHNGVGRTFRSGDAVDLAEKVVEVISEPQLAARLASAARTEAEGTYSLEAHCDRLMDVYSGLLQDRDHAIQPETDSENDLRDSLRGGAAR